MIHTDGRPTIAMRSSEPELQYALDEQYALDTFEANRDPGDETDEVDA